MGAPYTVHPIHARTDNYIWAICPNNTNQCIVVDPSNSEPVASFLKNQNKELSGILLTHHHDDHIGGVDALVNNHACPVFGPKSIGEVTNIASANTTIEPINKLSFTVWSAPGHTLDHIMYLDAHSLFCGDVLFSIGCGRLFEGNAKMGYHTLTQCLALPDDVNIYPAHEYTLANLAFAQYLEPDNLTLKDYAHWANTQRAHDLPTLPTTVGTERLLNPFLRCNDAALQQAVYTHTGKRPKDALETFAQLRNWKDYFKPTDTRTAS